MSRSAHSVLILPGFFTGHGSMAPLSAAIAAAGYHPRSWALGLNHGPTPRIIEGMDQRLIEIHHQNGGPVSLIGISLGGVFARTLARRHPDFVDRVITIGAPFRFRERETATTLVDVMWRMQLGRYVPDALEEMRQPEEDKPALTMPATSIYSRVDNIVPWARCLEGPGPLRENVEILATHVGLAFHPLTYYVVLDRLAARTTHWRPFQPPPWLRPVYRHPATFDTERARRNEPAAAG